MLNYIFYMWINKIYYYPEGAKNMYKKYEVNIPGIAEDMLLTTGKAYKTKLIRKGNIVYPLIKSPEDMYKRMSIISQELFLNY